MQTVSFTRLDQGTRADWALLTEYETEFVRELPDRLLAALDNLKDSFAGFQISRYEHSVQTATRAYRDGADEEWVVAALLHDLGDELASENHSEFAAAILKPYVRPEIHWAVKYHGLFQSYYYAQFLGGDRNAREKFQEHPHYAAAKRFSDEWDMPAFDPTYDSLPVATFEPLVRRVVTEPRYLSTGEV